MHGQLPLIPRFRDIQRLKSKNKDPKIKMSERFEFDYMGNSYFEGGSVARAIRHLHTEGETHEFKIDKTKVQCIYSTFCWTPESLEKHLNELASGKYRHWVEETPYFHRDGIAEQARCSKRPDWKDISIGRALMSRDKELSLPSAATPRAYDAWLELHAPVFWTVRPINLKDLRQNMRISVDEMDRRRREEAAHV